MAAERRVDGTVARVVVVEDEPLVRRGIRALVDRERDLVIVGEASNGHDAVSIIQSERPDLLLLDVHLPGLDGFGVLARLAPRDSPAVIVVTAHPAYAPRAFDQYAVDYLLKPFNPQRFRTAIERARIRLASRSVASRANPDAIDDAPVAASASRYIERVLIRQRGCEMVVSTHDIQWCEAADNYVRLYTRTGDHLIRMTLAALLDRMSPREFVRIHRSLVVRVDQIRAIRTRLGGRCEIVLASRTRLPLGRRYRDDVRRMLRTLVAPTT